MSGVVNARQHEPLDLLIWRTTGQGRAALPAVLAVNPGLAAIGVALPEGTAVLIPDLSAVSATVDMVQLWD